MAASRVVAMSNIALSAGKTTTVEDETSPQAATASLQISCWRAVERANSALAGARPDCENCR